MFKPVLPILVTLLVLSLVLPGPSVAQGEENDGDLSLIEKFLADNPGLLAYLMDLALVILIIGLVALFCYGLVRFASKKNGEGG